MQMELKRRKVCSFLFFCLCWKQSALFSIASITPSLTSSIITSDNRRSLAAQSAAQRFIGSRIETWRLLIKPKAIWQKFNRIPTQRLRYCNLVRFDELLFLQTNDNVENCCCRSLSSIWKKNSLPMLSLFL